MAFWNFNNFDNYLVTSLYMLERTPIERRISKDADFIYPSKFSN